MALDKTFDPKEMETRLYDAWEEGGYFKPGKNKGGKPFTIVIPPPNVTGSLHMGHALNNTIQDILSRFERMRGRDVLWQPGTDHAGIATQMVVERLLAKENNTDRRTMGREAFLKRVWEWKDESGGIITKQLRRLGASCDWSRERFTMDEGLSRAVAKVFVQLYKEGLIYKDQRLVNWDPVFETAISDLEVETRETKGSMWSFAYPLVDGPVDGISEIVISTTRPETMLGDGAVAVHPSDERYKNLIGKLVRLPIAERHIPIIADEYPDPEFGTGAVKITGAHDENDFHVAKRNNIPLIVLMDKKARMISTPENHVPAHYDGKDRYEARKMVLEEIEALGFYRGKEDKVIAQPFGDRSGVVIEPMLTEQWYVNAGELAKPAIAAVESGKTKFVPPNWDKTYYEWMRNIQPWCISRQLWWGHQIPAWYGSDGKIYVEETEAEAIEAAGPGVTLTRDEDVLDTWFSSALWPFSTLGWPDKTPELKRHYPTNTLVTGFDIIFFWVARMMMMGLHFMKDVPFDTVYIHALVRDEKGQKMSKSKGNVIDPLDLMDEFGADALRFTLAAMAAQGRDIKLAKQRVEGYRNFATKLWNAARFAEMNGVARDENFDPVAARVTVNRWIAGEAARTRDTVTKAIEEHKYNEAAASLYQFAWNVYCDWYVELIKPILSGNDEVAKAETRACAAWAFEQILHLLHPFMPFITEELWQKTAARDHMLIAAEWPCYKGLGDAKADAEMNWVIRLVSEVRSVRSEMNVNAGAKIPCVIVGAGQEARRRANAWEAEIMRLARLSSLTFEDAVPAASAQIALDEATVALPLEGMIDFAAERARLTKELEKNAKDISIIDGRLNNANFVAKAPPEALEESRDLKVALEAKKAKLQEALKRLG
ncbi:valine--tRNA ligase [Aestuariivirga litoralis]|uniref:valine--tRNA ligase n=1 Tax=Aestuariivirga litoralis TaxID=2650924 RepID=UPI0018C7DD77|nr:valine--tRNA ligase [Aestuariivirga litoralis]MBG1231339.1 valine--tRNA ligase [Aestuariivirga litoralis]